MNSPGLTHPRKPGFLRRLRVQLFRAGTRLILTRSFGADGTVAIERFAKGSSGEQTGCRACTKSPVSSGNTGTYTKASTWCSKSARLSPFLCEGKRGEATQVLPEDPVAGLGQSPIGNGELLNVVEQGSPVGR